MNIIQKVLQYNRKASETLGVNVYVAEFLWYVFWILVSVYFHIPTVGVIFVLTGMAWDVRCALRESNDE